VRFLILMVALLPACTAVNAQLGVGFDHYIEQGTNPRAVFRVQAVRPCTLITGKPMECWTEFNHHSSVLDGFPFNKNPEQLTNQWSIGVTMPLWKAQP
jgi:hypothetical protein